jgi:hypothetical protein
MENEMDGAYDMYERDEKCIQSFDQETWTALGTSREW